MAAKREVSERTKVVTGYGWEKRVTGTVKRADARLSTRRIFASVGEPFVMAASRYGMAFSGASAVRWDFARASWEAARMRFFSGAEGAEGAEGTEGTEGAFGTSGAMGAGFSHEARRHMRRMEETLNFKL